jgi:hypothetical protein
MSSEQKGVWIELVVAIATYAVYVIVVLGEVGRSSWSSANYGPLMLWVIGASVVATVIVRTVVSTVSPKDAGKRDIRDRQIYRIGEYMGRWAVIAGALVALILALLRVEYFWIANAIYLGFFLSAVLSGAVKISSYRSGVPAW